MGFVGLRPKARTVQYSYNCKKDPFASGVNMETEVFDNSSFKRIQTTSIARKSGVSVSDAD